MKDIHKKLGMLLNQTVVSSDRDRLFTIPSHIVDLMWMAIDNKTVVSTFHELLFLLIRSLNNKIIALIVFMILMLI